MQQEAKNYGIRRPDLITADSSQRGTKRIGMWEMTNWCGVCELGKSPLTGSESRMSSGMGKFHPNYRKSLQIHFYLSVKLQFTLLIQPSNASSPLVSTFTHSRSACGFPSRTQPTRRRSGQRMWATLMEFIPVWSQRKNSVHFKKLQEIFIFFFLIL